MDWKPELDAIVGARHEGRVAHVLDLLRKLDLRHPNIAEINHQLAWTLGENDRPAEALPYYEKAIALGLPPNLHSDALIGLGSALRTLGESQRAAEVFRSGRLQFPDNAEFPAFLALALHAEGHHTEALKLVIELLCDTSEDPGITAYQRSLRHAADRL